jgi:predicted ATP-dependent endonuclease of OLD family
LIDRFLRNITIQNEIRPELTELTKSLLKVKSHDLERYSSISADFSSLFPSLSFNAQPHEDSAVNQTNLLGERIELREKNPFTGKINTFDIHESAGAYAEVLYFLLQKSQMKESILVLDEPALRLHPSAIRHLNRILTESERQIILVTHSPYFVDISSLGPDRNLIYIKKDKDGSSKVFNNPTYQDSSRYEIRIKSYVFNPDILFSNYNILVEGAGDAASFYAISDSLGSLFERFNILVINANGHGNIDPYVEFMTNYQIPYIPMVDTQYNGENQPSDNFVVLDNKLEHELSAAGWTGNTDSSVDPDVAYNFVYETIEQAKIQKNSEY